jgi:hypothetical protein
LLHADTDTPVLQQTSLFRVAIVTLEHRPSLCCNTPQVALQRRINSQRPCASSLYLLCIYSVSSLYLRHTSRLLFNVDIEHCAMPQISRFRRCRPTVEQRVAQNLLSSAHLFVSSRKLTSSKFHCAFRLSYCLSEITHENELSA